MKITEVDAFQVAWSDNDKSERHGAFATIRTEGGPSGIGEASPMQSGLASIGGLFRLPNGSGLGLSLRATEPESLRR